MPTAPVDLSVVVPMYNEEAVLPLLVERLRPAADGWGVSYEVLCVDDGSTDGTPVLLQRLRREWPQVRVVRLRANAGHQAAISAGLARARGQWVVTLDADLQDPPEVDRRDARRRRRPGRRRRLRRAHRPVHRHRVQAGHRPGVLPLDPGDVRTSTPRWMPATTG